MRRDTPAKALPRIWAVVFVVVLGLALILFFLVRDAEGPAMTFVEDAAAGTLTVMDGPLPVLTYRFKDNLPPGLDAKQTRSCYLHPLYSLDGEPLTADFPPDHLHHHGLFWTWPAATVRGFATQTWHPAEPSLRQHFVRWVDRAADRDGARLVVECVWTLGENEKVVEETVTLVIHGASPLGRAIDISIGLRPVGGSLELRGSSEASKGYGGLTFRGASLFKGAAMTTNLGPLAEDSTGAPFLWADVSTPDVGVAVFVHPGHPGAPLDWLVRNSYAGVVNPCWPGLEGTALAADVPIYLRYRVYVHRGDAGSGKVREAYEAYASGLGR
jgi:hypothetical protein